MAIDIYLQIGDIKGESADDKHKGWIEVSHVGWGVSQPRSTSVSTAGGHTSGTADLSEMIFTKTADLSSPGLFQHCAMGKTIPKAVFEFMRADGDGKPINYYKVELALLSKSGEGRADAICGSFYNTGIVIGVPSRVKRFSTAARTCSSAT